MVSEWNDKDKLGKTIYLSIDFYRFPIESITIKSSKKRDLENANKKARMSVVHSV